MKPNEYTLHAIDVSLQSTTTSDKVEMMEETSKAISSDFIKKSHHLEKIQVENANLWESLTQQRKEDKARSSEIAYKVPLPKPIQKKGSYSRPLIM